MDADECAEGDRNRSARWRRLGPLYAAGFTTAFGAHGIAASLGARHSGHVLPLFTLGALLAVYDGAEIILKPVFGTLADRIGPRPVVLGGLVAFAVASATAAVFGATNTGALAGARLAQGAAASAFSPAASAMVARIGAGRTGHAFGSYGAWKSVGYVLGPLLGGAITWWGGFPALFTVLAAVAAAGAVWVAVSVPAVPPAPRQRQTLLDLVRRLTDRDFLRPTLALAATTAALSAGVGFLPVHGRTAGLSSVVTGAVVSLLACCAALVQPLAGRAHDRGRLGLRGGSALGLGLTAVGLAAAALPGVPGLVASAVGIGTGVGMATPLGFAALAATAPAGRMGRTMGAAELGREAGDAGGPLLVGAVAASASPAVGMLALAGAVAVAGLATGVRREGASHGGG
ncbi:MFS transporter [Streptomyces albospinus]|nr:MFS transporter [Streptomyces albospinus]